MDKDQEAGPVQHWQHVTAFFFNPRLILNTDFKQICIS